MSIGMQYQSTWESIKQHTTPSWFKKAKYGIYAHWGPYSVPAAGPNVTWYPYWMYREPSPQFDHHVKHFGHPSKFGYKDAMYISVIQQLISRIETLEIKVETLEGR